MADRIGIFGGTFDPIHFGHINLLKAAQEQLSLSKIIVVPNGNPPHKHNDAPKEDRLNMVNEALSDYPDFIVSDYETSSEEESYTYKTVKHFSEEFPDDELFFIMGMDNLEEFKFWVKPEDICKYCTLVFAGRDDIEFSEGETEHLKVTLNAKIEKIDYSYKCSSTEIREMLENGGYIFDMLSLDTLRYILKNGLYGTQNISEYDFYEKELAKYVEKKRFIHSLGVAATAYLMARKFGEDAKLAYFTGLLHDISKRMPLSEQLELCNEIKLHPDERAYPKMLHAPAGAAFIKKNYNITDEKLLSAVRYHTIGDVNMTLFDKILYMADYIEPSRDFVGVEKLRELSFTDIDKAVVEGINTTIISLIDEGLKISPCMLEVRNGLLDKLKKKTEV